MSKFIFKPSYVDFGFEPSTQTIKFVHEGSSIIITETPDWISDASITYTSNPRRNVTSSETAHVENPLDIIAVTGDLPAGDSIKFSYAFSATHEPDFGAARTIRLGIFNASNDSLIEELSSTSIEEGATQAVSGTSGFIDIGVTYYLAFYSIGVDAGEFTITGVSIILNPQLATTSNIGSITLTVGNDITSSQYSGTLSVVCDDDTYIIPCVYSYDSEHMPINSVIDSLMWRLSDQSYVGEKDRLRALLVAKQWIKDNSVARGTNMRIMEIPIRDTSYVYIPADYVDYIGLYTYTVDGYLMPLYVNNNINIAESRLVDENGFFILDENGFVITTYGVTPHPVNSGEYTYYGTNVMSIAPSMTKQMTVANGEVSTNGMFKYEPTNKRFLVKGVATDSIILQYVSDPILRDKMKFDVGGLCIHKNYQQSLEDYIYWRLIDANRHVPMNEKVRARREYYSSYADARIRKIKLTELIQVIRGF